MATARKSGRDRTKKERFLHNSAMFNRVRGYLRYHFDNSGTLEQLQNSADEQSNPELVGQHQSVHIVRLPIPASRDGLFIIKSLGTAVDSYPREARDLYAEACAMTLVARYTRIPVPEVYWCCKPNESNPQRTFIAMEYIEGEAFKGSLRLTRSQRISVIRQMAIIRIETIKVISASIGGVATPAKRETKDRYNSNIINTACEMGGPEVLGEGRDLVRAAKSYDLGPYSTIRAYVLAFLQKELAFYTLNPPKDDSWKDYAETLRKSLDKREFAKDTIFHLCHGDLVEGNNVILKGSKIVAIIDWETAAFLPFSEVVADLLPDMEAEFGDNTRPTHQKWIESMNEKYGRPGDWKAWELGEGLAALENNDDLDDELDLDTEYEEDEVEVVGGDWWVDEVVRQTWRLIELWMTTNSYDRVVWRDPMVYSICRMGISGPSEKLIVE